MKRTGLFVFIFSLSASTQLARAAPADVIPEVPVVSAHGPENFIGPPAPPVVAEPNTRNRLSDKMDQILSFVARCPSKKFFTDKAPGMLNDKTGIEGLSAEACQMDMAQLSSFKHMQEMQHFYQRLQLKNAAAQRPLESVLRSIQQSCESIFDKSIDSEKNLELLYDLSCNSEVVTPEEAFTGTDYADVANNTQHPQYGAYQNQVNGLAEGYKDSNFDPISSKGWKEEYDSLLQEKLAKSSLTNNPSPAMQQDLAKMCPGFASLAPQDKAKVWAGLFDAMAMAESSHNPNTTFQESFGPLSTGMLQISEVSAQGHYNMCFKSGRTGCSCGGATTSELKGPKFNLECGVTIMENQMATDRGIFGSRSYYWSVLNTTQNGFPKVMGRLKAVKSSGRWPAGCGS